MWPQQFLIDYVRVYRTPSIVSIASPAEGDVLTPGSDLTITVDAGSFSVAESGGPASFIET